MDGGLAIFQGFWIQRPILSGVFLGGIVKALYLRTRNPDQYVRLGRVIFEDATERPETDVDADGRGDVTERRGDVSRSEG